MKLLLILFVVCCVFPSIGTMLGNGLMSLAPVAEAFLPCLIVIAGLYLLIKSVLK